LIDAFIDFIFHFADDFHLMAALFHAIADAMILPALAFICLRPLMLRYAIMMLMMLPPLPCHAITGFRQLIIYAIFAIAFTLIYIRRDISLFTLPMIDYIDVADAMPALSAAAMLIIDILLFDDAISDFADYAACCDIERHAIDAERQR
jgi:hypothetical protein